MSSGFNVVRFNFQKKRAKITLPVKLAKLTDLVRFMRRCF